MHSILGEHRLNIGMNLYYLRISIVTLSLVGLLWLSACRNQVGSKPPAPCLITPGEYSSLDTTVEITAPSAIRLDHDDDIGQRIVIFGIVYRDDCTTPLVGALIEVRHTNQDGIYGRRFNGQAQRKARILISDERYYNNCNRNHLRFCDIFRVKRVVNCSCSL